mmetsp:Transcript_3115/g.9050  ORF Transcript_3115/g.9050 Transcript_3115/m.9050 type:complete len:215 (-) Transcript_3115:761-1405(-)
MSLGSNGLALESPRCRKLRIQIDTSFSNRRLCLLRGEFRLVHGTLYLIHLIACSDHLGRDQRLFHHVLRCVRLLSCLWKHVLVGHHVLLFQSTFLLVMHQFGAGLCAFLHLGLSLGKKSRELSAHCCKLLQMVASDALLGSFQFLLRLRQRLDNRLQHLQGRGQAVNDSVVSSQRCGLVHRSLSFLNRFGHFTLNTLELLVRLLLLLLCLRHDK